MIYMKVIIFFWIFILCLVYIVIKFLWYFNFVLGRGMINIMREGKIRREMERFFFFFVVIDK